jgi:hypothetical protein
VTRDGAPVPATLSRVVDAAMGVSIVVDSATAGAAALPAWLSAGARFILETPAQARAVVITASAPATVAAGPAQGPVDVVRGLEAVRPHGDRDTSAALTLAAQQFPEIGPGHKVVVLYTSAPDAGGETATALAARFRAKGLLLVVVGKAGGEGFWGEAATATGGFFAPAGDPVVVPALDQVRTTLQSRYIVEVPDPQTSPATLDVSVRAGSLELTGRAEVTAPSAGAVPGDAPFVPGWVWWMVAALGLLALAATLFVVHRGRPSEQTGEPGEQTGEPAPEPGPAPLEVARGRVAAPGAGDVARGRASVHAQEKPGDGETG